MAAIDKLNWFLSNVADETERELQEWLASERLLISEMKTENERQRAVKRLIDEYMQIHRVD